MRWFLQLGPKIRFTALQRNVTDVCASRDMGDAMLNMLAICALSEVLEKACASVLVCPSFCTDAGLSETL